MKRGCRNKALGAGVALIAALGQGALIAAENQLSLGVGYGEYGSMLRQESADRLVLMPRWQWYGERLYVENFDLGYNLYEQGAWSLDLTTQQSFDALLTRSGGLQNALIKGLANIPISAPYEVPPEDYIHPQARQLSYLAGSTLWYRHDAWQFQQSWHADVSGVHNGQQVQSKIRWHTEQGPLGLSAEAALRYVDSRYSNYYFGVQRQDTHNGLYQFAPGGHWLPSYQLNVRWQFAPPWQWIVSWRREHFPSAWLQNRYFDREMHQVWFSGVFYTW